MERLKRLINLMEARVYVSTEHVYAGGDYFGKWMHLADYRNKEEFLSAFRSLYPTEQEPVLLILCRQDIPKELAGTNSLSPKLFKLIRLISGFDANRNRAFHLWLEQGSPGIFSYKSGETVRLFEASYQGYFSKADAFGRYYADEYLAIDNPDFDYAVFGRQLLQEKFIEIGGYVFAR